MNNYFVYQHLVKGKVILVGMGTGMRYLDTKARPSNYRALTKAGFTYEILHKGLSKQHARDLEHYYINGYFQMGIKLCNVMLGKNHSESTKQKSSLSHMGQSRPFTKEHRTNISKALTGKKLSDEHKKNIGRTSLGRTWGGASKLKMSNTIKGKNHYHYGGLVTDQTKAKISNTLKERNFQNRLDKMIERQSMSLFN